MSDEEFKNHIEALAVKRLEKPKKLSSECMKHWKEILSRQYNFDRGESRIVTNIEYCQVSVYLRSISDFQFES